MVSAIYSNVTTVVDIKLKLNDTGTTDDDSFLTTAQYLDFILRRVASEATTYTLERVMAGYWRHVGGFYFFVPIAATGMWTPAGEDDCTYITTPNGTVYVSDGTHAGTDDLVLTAARIDLNELMVDLCMFIAQHRAQEVSIIMGDGSYTPEEVYRKLITMAETWRGVVALGP